MASEEEEQLQRLDDVTLSGSQSTEEGKRIQWPPLNHQIIADSVDFNSNVQQSVTDQQLDECDLNETTEPTCDQSNQLATNDEDVNEDTQINSSDSSELNSSEKYQDEEANITSELEEISIAPIPNKFVDESKMTVQLNQRRVSVLEIAVPPSSVLTATMCKPKLLNRKSSRPAIPGLVLSPPMKAVPYSQPSRPVISSHPVFKRTTPGRSLGATVWPPKFEYDELKPKCEEQTLPKRQEIDAKDVFSLLQRPARFATYRPPPGTQRVRVEVVGESVQL